MRTNFLIDQPVRSSMNLVTASAANTDSQAGVDGLALVVVDRPGFQVVLRHAEGLFKEQAGLHA